MAKRMREREESRAVVCFDLGTWMDVVSLMRSGKRKEILANVNSVWDMFGARCLEVPTRRSSVQAGRLGYRS